MTTLPYPSPDEPPEAEPAMKIMTALAELPPHALISEHQLAQLFGRHVSSIKRSIQRGELPPSVPLLNDHIWTAAVLWAHINTRLEMARQAAAQTARRLHDLRLGQGGHH